MTREDIIAKLKETSPPANAKCPHSLSDDPPRLDRSGERR